MISKEQIKASIYGLTVGDCLGVPVEFYPRQYFKNNPVKDMIGYGTYNQPVGTWSDNTSLSLATLDGMIGGLDVNKIGKNFVNYLRNNAFCQNKLFDIGNTTKYAIENIEVAIKSNSLDCESIIYGRTDNNSSGNGSLMRMIPVALYLYDNIEKYDNTNKRQRIVYMVSSITHASQQCLFGCKIYVEYAVALLQGENKHKAFSNLVNKLRYTNNAEINSKYSRLFNEHFSNLGRTEIYSSGYIVDSLEASIWCFLNTDNYKDAVLTAVNLGEDTDTIGCITGGLAGIYYGYDNIPENWINNIYKKKIINDLIDEYLK